MNMKKNIIICLALISNSLLAMSNTSSYQKIEMNAGIGITTVEKLVEETGAAGFIQLDVALDAYYVGLIEGLSKRLVLGTEANIGAVVSDELEYSNYDIAVNIGYALIDEDERVVALVGELAEVAAPDGTQDIAVGMKVVAFSEDISGDISVNYLVTSQGLDCSAEFSAYLDFFKGELNIDIDVTKANNGQQLSFSLGFEKQITRYWDLGFEFGVRFNQRNLASPYGSAYLSLRQISKVVQKRP